MARREVLTPSQRLRLDELPVDLDDRLIARHHTLSEEELALVSKRRGPANRLGFAVLLALLKFPGRPPKPDEGAPEKIVRYVASQIGEDPRTMVAYAGGSGAVAEARAGGKAGRESTRREHLSEIVKALAFRPFDADARGGLSGWLAGVAAMTDSGQALVEALLEEMRRRRVVIPALYAVEELAWEARRDAREETYQKAIAEVVNAHYRLPFSQHWGGGKTSSSDGQVFFAGGPKDALSQPNARYGRTMQRGASATFPLDNASARLVLPRGRLATRSASTAGTALPVGSRCSLEQRSRCRRREAVCRGPRPAGGIGGRCGKGLDG